MTLSKFKGSLLGVAIGDSLGAGKEGHFGFEEVRELSPRYTDDAAMTIGLAESLIACRGLDPDHLATQFFENYEREPWRGYGPGPPRIFRMMKKGIPKEEPHDKQLYPGGSFGNGSAMRIAPVGLFFRNDPEKLREAAHESSRITHSHPLAMEGAALEAFAVALAVKKEGDLPGQLMDFTREETYKRKLEIIQSLLDDREDKLKIVRELGNNIEAFNSVPAAIFSFLANTSFEESLVYAVSLGGDTDTIGAMCGAIAGAWYGSESIPSHWLDKVENREYLEQLAGDLWNIGSK